MTHNENATTKTPQLRAEYYGALNYLVGENVMKTSANTFVKSKKGKIFDTNTYKGLANNIVTAWVNSW